MGDMKDLRLLGILFIALAVRTVMLFSVFQHVGRAITPDSRDYGELGQNWAQCGQYLSTQAGITPATSGGYSGVLDPEIFRTPGYPAEIMVSMKIANFFREKTHMSTATHDEPFYYPPAKYQKILLSFQVLLDLHLVLLTFFLGRALAGHGAGLAAALFQAISPLAAAASCRILSDGVFAFMLTAALLLLLRHFRSGGWWSLLSAGLMMGAACYVRPVGLAFSAIMALVILCSRRGMGRGMGILPMSPTGILPVSSIPTYVGISPVVSSSPGRAETALRLMGGTPMPRPEAPSFAEATAGRLTADTAVLHPKRVLRVAAFAAVVVACIAPWVIRNGITADYWGFSSFATDSIYWYSAAEIEALRQNLPVEEVRDQFSREEYLSYGAFLNLSAGRSLPGRSPHFRTIGSLARYRWDKARSIILAHPWDFLSIHLKGDIAFWLPGAPDALEVLGYTSGGKGTLDVLHRKGLVAAAKHYFGDNTTAMALAGVMVVILLVRYAGIMLCGLWRLRPRMTAAGWLCLLLVLTAWLLPGPANHPRFRVPVEPILSVAAAIGYLGLLEWRRRRGGTNKTVEQ
jgi:hypothetical protein